MNKKIHLIITTRDKVESNLLENNGNRKMDTYMYTKDYMVYLPDREERSLLIGERIEQYFEELSVMDLDELKNEKETVYVSGDLEYYPKSKLLYCNGKEIILDRGELIILNKFMMHPTMVITIDKIMDSLSMAFGKNVSEESAKRELCRLRKKLDANKIYHYIETRYAIGYKWCLPVEKKTTE